MIEGKGLTTTAAFTIDTPSTTAKLDANRKAQVAFTVTNASIQPLKGRARVVAMDTARPEWFAIDGDTERAFASSGTQHYTVQVNVPATAPAGKYKFQLKVVGVANPDEQYGESQQVAFDVPQPVKKSTPLPMWIWLVAAVVALVVLGVGGFALYKAMNPDKAKGTFAPVSLSFDKQDVGTTSTSKTIRLTNTGSADLKLKAASFSDGSKDFPLSNDHCSNQTIKANASCSVDIAFAPLTTGTPTTKLTFANSGGLSLAVPLTGSAAYSRPGLYAGNWIPDNQPSGSSALSRLVITEKDGILSVRTVCGPTAGPSCALSGNVQFIKEPVLVQMSSFPPSSISIYLELKVDEMGNNLTAIPIFNGVPSSSVGFHRLSIIKIRPSFLPSLQPLPSH